MEGFKPAVDQFNVEHEGTDGMKISMDFTTERLSEQSATFAAGTLILAYLAFYFVCSLRECVCVCVCLCFAPVASANPLICAVGDILCNYRV